MKRLLCDVKVWIVLLVGFAVNLSVAAPWNESAESSIQEELQDPYLASGNIPVTSTTVYLYAEPRNEGATLEFQRRMEGTDAWVDISPRKEGVDYVDDNLKPRTTYEYRARAVRDGDVSDYVYYSVTTYSNFYNPSFEAEVIDESFVKLTLTDNSYADMFYELKRYAGSEEVIVYTQNMPDSGQTYVHFDHSVIPNTTYVYSVSVLIEDEGRPFWTDVESDTVYIAALKAPYVAGGDVPASGTTLSFVAEPRDEGATLEFERNMEGSSDWVRIFPETNGAGYFDHNLKPRTSYTYRIRAVKGDLVSEYSYWTYTTYSNFYQPGLMAELTPENKVKITITDYSYADLFYEVNKSEGGVNNAIFTIEMPDSGRTHEYIDESVVPNTTYIYSMGALVEDEGFPFYSDMAVDTIHVPGSYSLETPGLTFHEPPDYFTCGNEIGMNFTNLNEGAMTEIYRSLDSTSGFELVHSAEGSGSFVDMNLGSKTTYYYKARAVKGDSVSDYSAVMSKEAGYAFIEPGFEVTLLPDQTVEVKVHDRSYLDYSYELYGWHAEEGMQTIGATFSLPDSGQTFTIVDTLVLPGETYTYHVNATLNCDGFPGTGVEYVSEPVTIGEQLAAPSFNQVPPVEFYCESTIEFSFTNPNEGSQTEIFRSTNELDGYELIDVTDFDGRYVDESVRSNIVYYYKLRAVRDSMYSDFSEVWWFESPSDLYYPEISAQRVEGGIELMLLDRTYADLDYNIRRYEIATGEWMDLPIVITMPDSGSTFTYLDESALPNIAYRYTVDMTQDCDGFPEHYEIAHVDVEAGEGPAVFGFTLVDPATDMDVAEMYDSMEFNVNDRLNIRANTNDLTKSVAFFINGVRYWGENEEPYALFGDRFGDYNRGRFRPGEYTLTAVPYSENVHTGIEGQSMTIFFRVTDDHGSTDARAFVDVNVFPNPIVENATVELTGEPNSHVSLEIVDAYGNPISRVDETMDNFGWWVKEWNARDVKRGVYYMTIKVNDETHTKRILVK